jgi:chromatin remodeling complex protein RSC6
MVKASQSVPVTAPVATVPAAAPVVEKEKKTPKEPKEKKQTKKQEAPTPAPEPTPSVSAEVKEELPPLDSPESFDMTAVIKNMTSSEKFNCILALTNSLKLDYKIKEKNYSKELKQAVKLAKKRKTPSGPSGFDIQVGISDELAEFMEKSQGDPVTRSEVTRKVSSYVKEHKLQNPEKKTNILPDEKLKKLLKINDSTEPLTYTSVQKLLVPHYTSLRQPEPVAA